MISEADCKAAADELEAAGLSERERDALILTCKGLTAAEIGQQLGCAEKTINSHMLRARAKLEMTTIEAVVLATKAGWV